MIDHLLNRACVVLLVDSLLEAVEDLSHVERIENDEWKVFYVLLHLLVAIVAGLKDRLL